jgi:hypothetical protein
LTEGTEKNSEKLQPGYLILVKIGHDIRTCSMPSWHGAQLKHEENFTFTFKKQAMHIFTAVYAAISTIFMFKNKI